MSSRKSRTAAQGKLRTLLTRNTELKSALSAAFPEFTKVLENPGEESTESGGFSRKTEFMDWDADHPNGQCIYALPRK
jgi:hypothetical protein